jgi:uncharacterized protein (DUF58 family)
MRLRPNHRPRGCVMPAMSVAMGWALAVASVAAGYTAYGWPGVALAVSVVTFWLLLQFSQTLRLMRTAAQRPMGALRGSAVMLQTRLQTGQRLADVMKLTGSFGIQSETDGASNGTAPASASETETYLWTDDGGDAVRVVLRAGKVDSWVLLRAREAQTAAPSDA